MVPIKHDLAVHTLASLFAGFVTVVIASPADVVRARIMNAGTFPPSLPVFPHHPRVSCVRCAHSFRCDGENEGVRAGQCRLLWIHTQSTLPTRTHGMHSTDGTDGMRRWQSTTGS